MNIRKIRENIFWVGVVDWNRRLFDSLIPLPDGTSYNAYLITGSEKTALIDSVDPAMADTLFAHLDGIKNIDYVISHHSEQDHSGMIPQVLDKYPNAKVVVSPKGKEFLINHLHVAENKFLVMEDGSNLSLGDKTLKFIHTPWVHWPETMVSYLVEDKILFSCDFFGSHIASSDLFVTDEPRVYEAAKRYFAEIMMPFRTIIRKNIEKVRAYEIDLIAPSHGQIYDNPEFIIKAYEEWTSDQPKNLVVIPYISMHGSTKKMVDHMVDKLSAAGITAQPFDLSVTDIGKLAITLVDAATIVIGTPTVHVGAHPNVVYAACLANALRPKAKFATIIGSYGWGTKAVEQISGLIPNLKVEILPPVLCKGLPRTEDYNALDQLVEAIVKKHKENNL